MHNDITQVLEPKAVYVFASLAAIKESDARRLLKRAAASCGARVFRSGDMSCKDKDTFARVWEQATKELREVS